MDYVTRITKGRILNFARHSGKIHSCTRANFFSSGYIYIYTHICRREFSKPPRNPSYVIERSYLVVNHSQTGHVLYQLYPSLDVTDLFSTESFKKLGSNFESININEQKCLNKHKSIYRYFRRCKTVHVHNMNI